MSCEDGHNVSILDSNGKTLEWNGEDYVETGPGATKTVTETAANKDKDKDDKDSDQYLVSSFSNPL